MKTTLFMNLDDGWFASSWKHATDELAVVQLLALTSHKKGKFLDFEGEHELL